MTWFADLTGFDEGSPEQVRATLRLEGDALLSRANGRRFHCGALTLPALADLRARDTASGRLRFSEVIGAAQDLHADPDNAGALFQVASQFNLLEMASPDVSPARGITGYSWDATQGPACAMACAAGTLYRNYFVPVEGAIGQTEGPQIDALADLGAELGNAGGALWTMRNGYALATRAGLSAVSGRVQGARPAGRDALRGLLRIGLQSDTEVTLPGCTHRVSQAYCSALPVAYSALPAAMWEPFARLVLEAAYEATLRAAATRGVNRVYLTQLGGGAFGNRPDWITDSLHRALTLMADTDLDVRMVSFRRADPALAPLLEVFG